LYSYAVFFQQAYFYSNPGGIRFWFWWALPTVWQSASSIEYWNILIKSTKQNIDNTERLNTIKNKMTNETRERILNKKLSMTKALQNAINEFQQLINNNPTHRDNYLDQLIADLTERGEGKQTVSVATIKHREQSRSDHSKLRRVFKGDQGKGITRIEIPCENDPTKYKSICSPVEMMPPLINRNVNHFAQAEGTPFSTDPILKSLGYEGTNEVTDDIIDNNIIPEELQNHSKYVDMIFKKLGDGNKLPLLEEEITFEEFIAGFKKWKEKTTTSPSGRHLGHYNY
jgi:hypothetical protein